MATVVGAEGQRSKLRTARVSPQRRERNILQKANAPFPPTIQMRRPHPHRQAANLRAPPARTRLRNARTKSHRAGVCDRNLYPAILHRKNKQHTHNKVMSQVSVGELVLLPSFKMGRLINVEPDGRKIYKDDASGHLLCEHGERASTISSWVLNEKTAKMNGMPIPPRLASCCTCQTTEGMHKAYPILTPSPPRVVALRTSPTSRHRLPALQRPRSPPHSVHSQRVRDVRDAGRKAALQTRKGETDPTVGWEASAQAWRGSARGVRVQGLPAPKTRGSSSDEAGSVRRPPPHQNMPFSAMISGARRGGRWLPKLAPMCANRLAIAFRCSADAWC